MSYIFGSDEEFKIKVEKEFIDESENGEPEDYYYLHIEPKFGNCSYMLEDDVEILIKNLQAGLKKQRILNKKLGWKKE